MTDEIPTPASGPEPTDPRTPPATFAFLVQTLFTQALMALGRVPNPITKQSLKNLDTARHFIDTLAMLEAKTRGNLEAEEQRLLEEVQHQLRSLYVEARP